MAFELSGFKEAGGVGNSNQGGQLYVVGSLVDNEVTMITAGYLDQVASKLNVGDMVIAVSTDSVNLVNVASIVDGVVTLQ